MVFPTLQFAFFITLLLALLLVFRRSGTRKLILLVASWAFYMAWNPAYIWVILGLCFVDYWVGIYLERIQEQRKRYILLALSVVANLGMLAYFKYTGFLSDSLLWVFREAGLNLNWELWEITLPIGISFHTFQSISYTIDVYRRQLKPTHNWLDFLLFVAFFPQLVAGPIVRAIDFLPQMQRGVQLRYSPEAILLIGSGMVKKVVVADNLAPYVDIVMSAPGEHTSLAVMLATICFSTQIYCDFSGYSEIAIGLAALLGYWFPQNFNQPYFALNPSDFWRRWHISLSTWLRDYLYISLGGNRGGVVATYRNLALTMLLGGLWHGASWNFILWGAWHGALLIGHRLLGGAIAAVPALRGFAKGRIGVFISWFVFQYCVLISWIMFRLTHSGDLMEGLRKFIIFDGQLRLNTPSGIQLSFLLMILLGFWAVHTLEHFVKFKPRVARAHPAFLWGFVALCTALLLVLWPSETPPFIYFQF
ncbi:MBOAT family protein [bacterium]|nr:MBOAT family protein [bacterium]